MHFTTRLLASDVRVRFAPSPTGKLHLGGLRTALFNFLFARKHGGSFILRIEDTDVARTIPGCAEKFEEILDGFGLRRDESPLVGGEYGPYVQTQRKDLYGEAAQRLIDSGHAYQCFCTSERLEILRKNAFRKQEIPRYDNRCRSLSKEESAARERDAQPYVIRFKFNRETVKFNDIVFGENIQTADEGDFIIIKSDGLPTYHFANVVDDQFMKISHVIRGAEWIPSCPKHIKLYESFKWTPPTFLHLPLITKDGHKKLSKRDNSAFVEYYTQEKGYLPLAILNYLLRNGSGLRDYKNDYCYSLEEMIKNFDENTIGTRDFMTDKNSLEKYGRLSFKQATPDYLMNAIVDHVSAKLPHVGEDLLTPEYIERVISFLTSNEETFSCLSDISSGDFHFFFGRPENGEKLLTKYDVVTCTRVLDNVISLPHLTPAGIKGVAAAMEIPAPDCFLIVRCALIDSFTGPPVGELFTFFSREECITRMNVVRQSLNVHQTQTVVLNG
jgi:glutamyl-tRNA synthetase